MIYPPSAHFTLFKSQFHHQNGWKHQINVFFLSSYSCGNSFRAMFVNRIIIVKPRNVVFEVVVACPNEVAACIWSQLQFGRVLLKLCKSLFSFILCLCITLEGYIKLVKKFQTAETRSIGRLWWSRNLGLLTLWSPGMWNVVGEGGNEGRTSGLEVSTIHWWTKLGC